MDPYANLQNQRAREAERDHHDQALAHRLAHEERHLIEAGYDPTNYFPEDDDQILDSYPDEGRDDGP